MMIHKYMNSVNPAFLTDEIREYANEPHTQAEIVKYLIKEIIKKVNVADMSGIAGLVDSVINFIHGLLD